MIFAFWASWCEACERELPTLQKVADKWKKKQVEVIGINIGEDPLVIENICQRLQINFTMVLDRNKKISKAFGVRALPTIFFINPQGVVQEIVKEAMTEKKFEFYLQQIAGQ